MSRYMRKHELEREGKSVLSPSLPLFIWSIHETQKGISYAHLRVRAHTPARNSWAKQPCMVNECGLKSASNFFLALMIAHAFEK
jgi:hypothetical protein